MAELPNRTLGRGLAMLELLSQRPDGLKLYEIADYRHDVQPVQRRATHLEHF